MQVAQIAPGLWRWTARHPDWTAEDARSWEPDVGCVYCELDGGIVLIDPLVPAEIDERERFWRALDRDVERLARAPAVLLTLSYHARSAADLHARYAGAHVWAEERAREDACARTPVTGTFRAGDDVAGVRTFDARRFGEVAFWLPAHHALVAGDVLLGDGFGGVRVCPDDWLGDDVTPSAVRDALRPLLDLPVERVLVSHGEPVLAHGRDALARALGE